MKLIVVMRRSEMAEWRAARNIRTTWSIAALARKEGTVFCTSGRAMTVITEITPMTIINSTKLKPCSLRFFMFIRGSFAEGTSKFGARRLGGCKHRAKPCNPVSN